MLRILPPLSAWSSAFIAALVGFGGTIALVIEAMRHLGASTTETGSGVTAICLGMAIAGALLSIRLKMPVVLAWSTPGAALLAASAAGMQWPVAIGVFVSAALMMMVPALIPAVGRLVGKIPPAIASAMLAGVLLPFCLRLFRIGGDDPLLIAMLLGIFVVARQCVPLYALLITLVAGMAVPLLRGDIGALPDGPVWGALKSVMPVFDVGAIVSIGVPLFLVTLVSQNLPGLVILRNANYEVRPRPLLSGASAAWLLAAPFGAMGINLAAITAAICTSDEAHPDHSTRWQVGVLYAGFYFLLGVFAPLVVRFFLALPAEVIAALTGLALIPALLASLEGMFSMKDNKDAAILTFLATGSGLTVFGLGSAFWGLVIGFTTLTVGRWLKRA